MSSPRCITVLAMKDVKCRGSWVLSLYDNDFKLSTSRETIVEVNNWLKDAAIARKSGGASYETMRLGELPR